MKKTLTNKIFWFFARCEKKKLKPYRRISFFSQNLDFVLGMGVIINKPMLLLYGRKGLDILQEIEKQNGGIDQSVQTSKEFEARGLIPNSKMHSISQMVYGVGAFQARMEYAKTKPLFTKWKNQFGSFASAGEVTREQERISKMMRDGLPEIFKNEIPVTVVQGVGMDNKVLERFVVDMFENNDEVKKYFQKLDSGGVRFEFHKDADVMSTDHLRGNEKRFQRELKNRLNSDKNVLEMIKDAKGRKRKVKEVWLGSMLGDIYGNISDPEVAAEEHGVRIKRHTVLDLTKSATFKTEHDEFLRDGDGNIVSKDDYLRDYSEGRNGQESLKEFISRRITWHNDGPDRLIFRQTTESVVPPHLVLLMPIEMYNIDPFIASTMLMAPYHENAIANGERMPLRIGDCLVMNDRVILHGKPPMWLIEDSKPGWRLFLRMFMVLE